MKRSIFLLFVIAFALTVQAKIWRVNNNAAINANFTSFVAAQATVSANDTLYFEGSTVSYGNIVLTKPLVIIGPGYFLEENPQTQSNPITAKFGTIGFNSGSSGSIITGALIQNQITINVSNVSIIRCYTADIGLNSSLTSIGNIILLGNYVNGEIYNVNNNTNPIINVIVSNNFCYVYFHEIVSGVMNNNIFNSSSTMSNFVVSNNILKAGSFSLNNNTFYNNISYGTQFPIGNGNQQNKIMTDVFVGTTGNSTDGQWKLKEYSPALGAGNDGTDCGMFGGSSPYVLSGLPSIPAIYEITMPTTGDNINGIDVTIKAKTH